MGKPENAASPCTWHKPHRLGYREFFEWAERLIAKGFNQERCGVCKYWFFPSEMGTRPEGK